MADAILSSRRSGKPLDKTPRCAGRSEIASMPECSSGEGNPLKLSRSRSRSRSCSTEQGRSPRLLKPCSSWLLLDKAIFASRMLLPPLATENRYEQYKYPGRYGYPVSIPCFLALSMVLFFVLKSYLLKVPDSWANHPPWSFLLVRPAENTRKATSPWKDSSRATSTRLDPACDPDLMCLLCQLLLQPASQIQGRVMYVELKVSVKNVHSRCKLTITHRDPDRGPLPPYLGKVPYQLPC